MVTLAAVEGSVAEAAADAIEEGRALLADWNADLLIWGEVKKADQELNLWFLGRGGEHARRTLLLAHRKADAA